MKKMANVARATRNGARLRLTSIIREAPAEENREDEVVVMRMPPREDDEGKRKEKFGTRMRR